MRRCPRTSLRQFPDIKVERGVAYEVHDPWDKTNSGRVWESPTRDRRRQCFAWDYGIFYGGEENQGGIQIAARACRSIRRRISILRINGR